MHYNPGNRTPARIAPPRLVLAALGITALVLLPGCTKPHPAPPSRGPTEVGVVTLKRTTVALSRELPGRVSAYRVAEVRARVNGIVLKRLFAEGAYVKAGQLLYQIDAAPYRFVLASAKAQLARAEANVASARLQAGRYAELVDSNAVSKQEYDNAVAAKKAAEADVAAGQAAVATASINLGYTGVTAPISGRIGRSAVTEGAYVQAEQATLLATVQQIAPAFVDITQSSAELLHLRREFDAGTLQRAGIEGAEVKLIMEDGGAYPQAGALQFSDVTVDPSTGSVTLRALFPNPKGELLPGMFVRARLDEAVDQRALLVPQRAVTRDQKGKPSVLAVGADGKAEVRQLTVDREVGADWLVSAGLNAGDQVIVDGLQNIRPGAPVKVVSAAPAPSEAQPSAAASSPSPLSQSKR